jgi:hypothetical protein
VDPDEAEQILIDWRNFLRENRITETVSAAGLARRLRCIRKADNSAVAKQIAELDAQLSRLDNEIIACETALNNAAYELFRLSASEIRMVQDDQSQAAGVLAPRPPAGWKVPHQRLLRTRSPASVASTHMELDFSPQPPNAVAAGKKKDTEIRRASESRVCVLHAARRRSDRTRRLPGRACIILGCC